MKSKCSRRTWAKVLKTQHIQGKSAIPRHAHAQISRARAPSRACSLARSLALSRALSLALWLTHSLFLSLSLSLARSISLSAESNVCPKEDDYVRVHMVVKGVDNTIRDDYFAQRPLEFYMKDHVAKSETDGKWKAGNLLKKVCGVYINSASLCRLYTDSDSLHT